MSTCRDTSLDRREAVSALLMMLAAVMGLGALQQGVEAQEPLPALYLLDEAGIPVPQRAFWLAYEAGVYGKSDDEAAQILADASRIQQHFGQSGIRDVMHEMRLLALATRQ